MRSLSCLVLAFALGCTSGGHGPTAGGPTLLPETLEAANRSHKPLVVELGAAWCKPCHVFADQVLTDPRVQAALHDVVFVQYDIDTPAGADAMHRCNVTEVPAIVSLDRDGAVRQRKTGTAPTVDEFLAFLRQASAEGPH